MRLEELGQLKKIHLIGTRTRDLPACSIVPQPTTLPRAPHEIIYVMKFGRSTIREMLTQTSITFCWIWGDCEDFWLLVYPLKVNGGFGGTCRCLLHAGTLLHLFFKPEDGGDFFFETSIDIFFFEKPTIAQPLEIFPAYYGIRRFSTVFPSPAPVSTLNKRDPVGTPILFL
jgi:hypothetical protein